MNINEITAVELKDWIDSGKDFQLIDVREPFEYEEYNISGELIPLGDIVANIDKIAKDKTVVIHCRSGKRSTAAIVHLHSQGYVNLINLKGGILACTDIF